MHNIERGLTSCRSEGNLGFVVKSKELKRRRYENEEDGASSPILNLEYLLEESSKEPLRVKRPETHKR
jgi:hypothetical protein